MFRTVVRALTLAFIASISVAQAQEAPPCGDFVSLKKDLKQRFGESPTIVGAVPTAQVGIVILSSEGGATWTLVMVKSNGIACLMASGKGLKLLLEKGQEL